jgi:hypothetical protein
LVARASYLGISDLAATMLRGAVVAAALLLAAAAVGEVPGAEGFHLGGDESGLVRGVLAALREKAEAEDAARFAVAQHNRNQVRALVTLPRSSSFPLVWTLM